jgi:hypothetical protein
MNIQAYAKLLANDLSLFTRRVFETINPNTPYVHNWHVDYLASVIANPDNKRLIINIPPRSLKSTLISIAFPAWLWARNPSQKIICISYGANLASRDSINCKKVLESDWYRACFPHIQLSERKNTNTEYYTTQEGVRFSTSTGGILTGLGADVIICDDLLNAIDAPSKTYRDNVNEWFESALFSRLDNKETGRIIVVGQRLHVEDITGFLLHKGGWQLLKLPAQFSEDLSFTWLNPLSGNLECKIVKAGDAMNVREPLPVLEMIRAGTNSYAYASQYLQEPTPLGGGEFKKKDVCYYEGSLDLRLANLFLLYDPANSKTNKSDYTAIVLLALMADKNIYLVDLIRDRLSPKERIDKLFNMHKKYSAFSRVRTISEQYGMMTDNFYLKEEMAKQNYRFFVEEIKTKAIKEERIRRLLPFTEQNRFYVPLNGIHYIDVKGERRELVKEFIEEELVFFPNASHDDMLDATTRLFDVDFRFPDAILVDRYMPRDYTVLSNSQDKGVDWRDF